MQTFRIITLGCKVNTYESQAMAIDLEQHGYIEAKENEPADIYIIHTCAVTNTAAFKSRQKIRQAIKANPEALVIAVGCYVQTSAPELSENKDIDVLIGSSGKSKIAELVTQALATKGNQQVLVEDMSEAVFEKHDASVFEHQVRAYLKIQDGCNQFCSYCIIPYSRGRERSLDENEAVASSLRLCSSGHQEIVLTGIHTGRYGRDIDTSLTSLMKRILNENSYLERLRLSSIEINEITDEMIQLMKQDPRIARHLHIPLQAGCDATLNRMKRPYNTEQFYDSITKIRQEIPNISISTDVIVGFPQESEEEFASTVEFIKKCNFSFLHVFPFSMRKGTVAQTMPGHLPETIKKERVRTLLNISNENKKKFAMNFLNKEVDVLIETKVNDTYYGYTSEYIRVGFKCEEDLPIGIYRVKLLSVQEEICYGERR